MREGIEAAATRVALFFYFRPILPLSGITRCAHVEEEERRKPKTKKEAESTWDQRTNEASAPSFRLFPLKAVA